MSIINESHSLRDRSREVVFDLIAASAQGQTRSDLAAQTGMSRSVVVHAVARLLDSGRIREDEPQSKGPGGGSGRPAARLHAVPTSDLVGGIDLGHNHIAVALADTNGQILSTLRRTFDVDLDAPAAIAIAAELLDKLKSERTEEVGPIVAGIPGPIDSQTGIVTSPTILSGWVGRSPAAELSRAVGSSVHVENDSLLGAYAETRLGVGRFHANFLYVKASHGIGASLVIDGKPYRGATGIVGEIGHTHLPGRTEPCRCGDRGCLEAVVSVQSVRNQLQHTHPHLDTASVDLAELTDPVGIKILTEAGRALGKALADLSNLINPGAVVLGGELGASGPAFLRGVEESIRRHAQPATAAVIEVVAAVKGSDTELIGALHLATTLSRA